MPPTIRPFNPPTDTRLIPYLAALHAGTITSDHLPATFLPPLSHHKLLAWWKDRITEITASHRIMFLLFESVASTTITTTITTTTITSTANTTATAVPSPYLARPPTEELMGVVILSMPATETAACRGEVEMLMVHPKYRRRGGARLLMDALEEEARKRNRALLYLETEAGSPSEEVFGRLGWTKAGVVPDFNMSPAGGLRGKAMYYRQLPTSQQN